MKIAILLLCHEKAAQLHRLLASPFFASPDVKVYVHLDAAAPKAHFDALVADMPAAVQAQVLTERVRCAWGEYSLVEATHRLMRAALADTAFVPERLLLISGACIPIRPLASLQAFLAQRPQLEFIQAVNVALTRWVRGGLEIERLTLRFPFNYRTHRAWFDRATRWQQRLGLQREVPPVMPPVHFGSQWFCLTRATAAQVSESLDNPALQRFLRTTWIPDEFAIQSLVARHAGASRIAGHNLTYYEFDHKGQPLVLEDGHFEHLMRQPYFFARKLAPQRSGLAGQLAAYVGGVETDVRYFEHVGRASSDYQRHVARALHSPAARASVGTLNEPQRGVMGRNQRTYLVLFASSPGYLQALAKRARELAGEPLPLFDFLFEPGPLVAAQEHAQGWWGVTPGQTAQRDRDAGAFWFGLLQRLPGGSTPAVCVNPARAGWMRDLVVQDPNAVLMYCDPEGLSPAQMAQAWLRDAHAHRDQTEIANTYRAVHSALPLPQGVLLDALRSGKHGCRALQIQHIAPQEHNPVLRALRSAWQQVDAAPFYASDHDAHASLS